MRENRFVARRLVRTVSVPALGLALATAVFAQSNLVDPRSIAPNVPAPWEVVDRMLALADVSADDVVYDLGSGDGRILVRAAKKFGARAVGLEINHALVVESESAIRAAGVENLTEIREQNIFDADLRLATVVTVYVMSSSYEQLKPKFALELRPGTRLVSYGSTIPGWNAAKTETVSASGKERKIYLYVVGQ